MPVDFPTVRTGRAASSVDAHNLQAQELIERVRRSLLSVPPAEREAAIDQWAASLRAATNLSELVTVLAAAVEPELRQLALRLAVELPGRLTRPMPALLRRLLADRTLPVGPQLLVTARLVREAVERGKRARPALRAFVTGLPKPQVVDRLVRLEQRTGPVRELVAMRRRYEKKIKTACPRCHVRLPRPEMVKHLWLQHRLIVVGRKLRKPWRLIHGWLDEYRRDGNPLWLERARTIAQNADPERGLLHLDRLLLIDRLDDSDARADLVGVAARKQASICPHCFALIPFPEEAAVAPLHVGPGSLEGHGYRIAVSEHGFFTSLRINAPGGYQFEGREPHQVFTIHGASVLLAGPVVLLALLLALDFLLTGRSALWPVVFLLLAAVAVAAGARWLWRMPQPALDRAVDSAWALLVPRLHVNGYQLHDSQFLAGLALASAGRGQPRRRGDQLLRALEVTEQTVAAGTSVVTHLGALWRLAVEDAASGGVDPVTFAVAQAARSFEGKLPFAFADQLFTNWGPHASPGQRARLRVLLADRAFEAGCEIRDLIDLGKQAPAFGAALGTDHLDYVAQLRLLWSLRPTRPWADCGASATVFELAADARAGVQHMAKHPDLLLALWDVPGGYICSRGLLFHDVLFAEPPAVLEIKARSYLQGGGYELLVGDQRFWFQTDPGPVLVRLERWFRYYFREFRPRAASVFGWPSQARFDRTRFHCVVRCPECRCKVQLRVGNLAVATS